MYEALIPTLVLPDPEDCHVLAAAITSVSSSIVTYNLSNFHEQTLSAYTFALSTRTTLRLIYIKPIQIYLFNW